MEAKTLTTEMQAAASAQREIRTERVDWPTLERHREAWRRLSLNAADGNVFNDPGFALPAAEALGVADSLQVMLAWRGEGDARELVGLMAFRRRHRWGIWFPVVEVWTHPYAPACLPLVDTRCAEAATIALFDAVTRDPTLPGIVMLPLLSLDTAFAAALLSVRKPLYVHAGHQRAVANSELGGDAYLATAISGKRRRRLGQQQRGLAREAGEIAFAVAREPGELGPALDTFLSLEASGWKGAMGTALASSEPSARMSREIVTGLGANGHTRILIMTAGDKPVAGVIGFVMRDTAWIWKIAYDEAHARASPGKHAFLETVRLLMDERPGLFVDSCATPDHPLAGFALREHMAMGDVVVSSGGTAGPAFRIANLLERLRGSVRAILAR